MSPSLEPGLLQNPELLETSMSTYYFVAASEAFLTQEEPLEEVLRERAFLNAPEFQEQASAIPQPAAAVISTDAVFIDFMKLRLEYVLKGSFEAPSAAIPDPLAGA